MYKVLGFINIGLLVIVLCPFIFRKMKQWFIHSKSPKYAKFMKALRLIHKPAALLLLASIFVHGWLALGALSLHTGTVAAASFVVTALFGLLFYLLHKKRLLQFHRLLALLSVLLVAVHLLFPWLLSGI